MLEGSHGKVTKCGGASLGPLQRVSVIFLDCLTLTPFISSWSEARGEPVVLGGGGD